VLDDAEACTLEARAKLMCYAQDFADVWVVWGYQWGGVALVATRPPGAMGRGRRWGGSLSPRRFPAEPKDEPYQ
jgi:hypothetical protein